MRKRPFGSCGPCLIVVALLVGLAACSNGSTDRDAESPERSAETTRTESTPTTSLESAVAAIEGSTDEWKDEALRAGQNQSWMTGSRVGDLGLVVWMRYPEPDLAVVLRADGRWAALPDLPWQEASLHLSSAGGTVLLTGLDCDGLEEDECDSGAVPASYRYDPEANRWGELDLPGVEARASGVRPMPSVMGSHAVLTVTTGLNYDTDYDPQDRLFSVDAYGGSVELPLPPDGYAECVVGNQLVAMDPNSTGAAPAIWAPDVATLDLDAAELEWEVAPDPTESVAPPDSPYRLWYALCGPDGPIFLGDGVEMTYDVVAGEWVKRELALPVHLDQHHTNGPGVDAQDFVVLDDGTLLTTTGSRAVVRRTAVGEWEDVGLYAQGLVSAGDSVWAWSLDDSAPARIEP